MRKLFFFILLIGLLYSCVQRQKADRIFFHAIIWTGDSSNPKATAIGIKDSTILFVGNEYAPYQGEGTEMIDLGGKMITPGFIDNHTHFLSGGYQLANVNLRDVKTKTVFIDSIRAYIETLRDDRWVMGGDWDHEAWGGVLPDRHWIDSVCGNHPVFVNRYDGHMALANSKALAIAGIDKHTAEPPGGQIVRDPKTGEPTGVLRDGAMELMNKVIPPPSASALGEYLQRAIGHGLAHGVTQVHDMGSFGGWTDLFTYRKAYTNKQLGLRVYAFMPVSTWKMLDTFVRQTEVEMTGCAGEA